MTLPFAFVSFRFVFEFKFDFDDHRHDRVVAFVLFLEFINSQPPALTAITTNISIYKNTIIN